jgi:hypothetical protein
MSRISLDNNLSMVDRLLRGGLGFSLMARAVRKPIAASPWMMLGGVLLTLPALTGTDPILRFLGISTHPGDENFFLNLMKQVKPGHGVKPSETEQARPLQLHWPVRINEDQPLAEALTIG